ncbi:APC family permease [uncultured Brevundimonas sp.]|uniref:APC family permease n=1 Tax=uncultured Brevundimonas sp. TaxID=213418 RepID=UPI0030EDA4D8
MKTHQKYKADSLSLAGAVAMGTGVMIGAGIFALTGQVAEFAGPLFPLAFVLAAIVSGFSAYTYIKVSNKYPSAGGIAMVLQKAYGRSVMTGASALLMTFSMIISESLVARTFGTYTLQLFGIGDSSLLVPILAVSLILLAFVINLAGNAVVGGVSKVAAFLKVGGIAAFAIAALWVSGLVFRSSVSSSGGVEVATSAGGFLAGVALAILAYKGFTTITNSGGEVKDPKRNVGRAIIISLAICFVIYMLVALAVGSALTIDQIVAAKNYALAEAARPALGETGMRLTVLIAIIATASGVLASLFAVSRMLTMLTEMRLIPHSHFGLPGENIQRHLLVYTAATASVLAAFFDLSRIASLGVIFYLVMDMAVHWGVFSRLRKDVEAKAAILLTALILDACVLGAFMVMKFQADPIIIAIALTGIAAIVAFEKFYLGRTAESGDGAD